MSRAELSWDSGDGPGGRSEGSVGRWSPHECPQSHLRPPPAHAGLAPSGPSPDCSLSPIRQSGGERPPGMDSDPGVRRVDEGLEGLQPPLGDRHQVLHVLPRPVPPLLAQTGARWERSRESEPAHTLLPGFLRRAPKRCRRNQDVRRCHLTHAPGRLHSPWPQNVPTSPLTWGGVPRLPARPRHPACHSSHIGVR